MRPTRRKAPPLGLPWTLNTCATNGHGDIFFRRRSCPLLSSHLTGEKHISRLSIFVAMMVSADFQTSCKKNNPESVGTRGTIETERMKSELVTLESQVDVLQKALAFSARQNDDVLASNVSQISALAETEKRIKAMTQLLSEAATHIENVSKERDSLQAELQRTKEWAHAHNRTLEDELHKLRASNAALRRNVMGDVGESDLISLHAAFSRTREEVAHLDQENIELAVLADFLQGRISVLERSQRRTATSQESSADAFAQLDLFEKQICNNVTHCRGLERQVADAASINRTAHDTLVSVTDESGVRAHNLIDRATELARKNCECQKELARSRSQYAVRYISFVCPILIRH